MSDIRSEARAGVLAILPATVAAAPFALILGQQAVATGLSPLEATAMATIVFAGSAQFLALSLWTDPVAILALALSVLLINLRHVLMGASISHKVGRFGPIRYPAAFLLTDELWAVAERRALDRPLTPAFWFAAGGFLYLAWIVMSVFGALGGAFIRDPQRYGLDFAFPVIFIALVLGFWRGWRSGAVIAASAAASIMVHRLVPGAWYVIAGAAAGILAALAVERAAAAENPA